jgi:hypothetical protein
MMFDPVSLDRARLVELVGGPGQGSFISCLRLVVLSE